MSAARERVLAVGRPSAEPVVLSRDRQELELLDAALHDLSQPLTSVALALEILTREQDPAAVEAMLVAARSECARAMVDVNMLRTQTNRLLNRTTNLGKG